MRLDVLRTNRTVHNAKVSLFFRETLKERLYIMKTRLSNNGNIAPNAYCLISDQIILGQIRYSHFTQGCSRYLHSPWGCKRCKTTED